ncbi:MAG: diacylglycerol kinase [Chloroflexi bacterium]|nr:diacylglycerol kinase [Chloroflexota bacterium]
MPEPGVDPGKGFFNVLRIARAARYTVRGFRHALANDTSFRQEFVIAFILAPIGVWLGDTGVERALLVMPLLLVLLVELLNGALETAIDRIGTEHNELSGRAKDLASAAVFIALLSVPVMWGLVLLG